MTTDDILTYTLEHGGGTFHSDTLEPVNVFESVTTAGWAVGGSNGTASVTIHSDTLEPANVFKSAIDRARQSGAPYVGTWGDAGDIVVDAVDIFTDTDEAIVAAIARDEGAIYHLSSHITLRIEGAS